MKDKLLIILTLAFFASFPSCKKAPLTVGKIVTQTRELPDFHEVRLNDNVSISLVRSDTCYIEIKTGENIIDNITTEVKNGVLTICNTSTLDWIRTYDYELHATLYFKYIKNFVFSSSGTLETKNQYNNDSVNDYHSYRFEIDGGSGDVDILVNNCGFFHFIYKYGTSRANIHGSNNGYLNVYKRSYGIFDAINYSAKNVKIVNYSTGDCYINASKSIDATIYHLGDIYYKGEPDSIKAVYGENARGKLIKV